MSWVIFLSGLAVGVLVTVAGMVWVAFAGTATQKNIESELQKERSRNK